MNSIVRFLKNKNTVTVIGVIAIIGILWGGYYFQLQRTVKPKSVPVAATTIQPRTQITSDMIEYVDVPSGYISDNAIINEQDLLNKYANYNTIIPEGSMFYKEAITTKEALPNYVLSLLKEGEFAVSYDLSSTEMTTGWGIMPGDKIDLYMRVKSEESSVMLGKLIENVEILAVTDENGNNVYEVNDGNNNSGWINLDQTDNTVFALPLSSCETPGEESTNPCYSTDSNGVKTYADTAVNSIFGYVNGSTMAKKSITSSTKIYDLIIFLEENNHNQNEDQGKTYNGTIKIETTGTGDIITGRLS